MAGNSRLSKLSRFIIIFSTFHLVSSVVYFNQPGYMTYKQAQKTSQYNTFELQFKTIDATGVLLHAQSVEKNDFLTIELVRGKIRYAAEFGNGVINIDKQVTGYHQLYVGQDLADNQWHSVKVTQSVQDISIIIDGKREPKYFGFRRAPPAPTDFSVEEVFLGGLYSYVGVPEEKSVAQEGTACCMRLATMNGINLLGNYPSTIRSNILSYCPTINYYPLFFPNKVSHMALKDYNSPSLKLKFDFRTVVSDQKVVNYTNVGKRTIELSVNREGRLVLGLIVENTGSHLVMKTAKQQFHDGKWHSVEFLITNKAPGYDAEFIVDGVKRRSQLNNPFLFNGGPLHFGFGYTGCMKNLVLNDRNLDYTKLQKVAVMMGKCPLKDFCTPNPCIEGGKCNQTDTIFRCDCRHTPYTGTCCSQSRFNYSCLEVHQKAGDRFKNDKYWLDLDGLGGLPPIRAFCRGGRTPIDTITQINITIPHDINVINPSGRKIIPVTYLADEESLRELLLHHKNCRQFIRYRCARSALFNSPAGPKQAQWMGFDDKLHYYWGGSGGKRGFCACGMTRTCRSPEMNCNCDSVGFVLNLEDRGYLNIKEHLPVRRIDYFDVKTGTGKVGISTIGPLQCWGNGAETLAATFREPFSFLQIALTDENDWNNNIDAGDVAFEFLTTTAAGVMVFAKGPFSGDFLQIKLLGRTRARATMNLGYYKNLHLDVDIAKTQRTFDDNFPHKLRLDWNRREMNFTVDNITRIVEFHYQYGVTHLDIDGTPFYVGGRNDGLDVGFMGCIRSFYYGGKLVDLPLETEGLSSIGVYPGQGAACKLVKHPCNQGFCIEEYNQYKCNCSVSAFAGPHCELDRSALTFRSGMYLEYTFQNQVDVDEGYIVVAFKTKLEDAAIFQLRGKDNSHISLMIVKNSLKLFFNFKSADVDGQLAITVQHPTPFGKFSDDKRHSIRVHHKGNRIYVDVLNDLDKPINHLRNVTSSLEPQAFSGLTKLFLGKRDTLLTSLPTLFDGCISGFKYQYQPAKSKVGVSIDMIKLYTQGNRAITRSNPSPTNTSCGASLPLPPPLPTVIPPQQFRFRNPVVTVAPIGVSFSFSKIVVVVIIIVLAILSVILLFITIRCVEKYQKKYKGKEKNLRLLYNAQAVGKTDPPAKKQPEPQVAREQRQEVQPARYEPETEADVQPIRGAASAYDNRGVSNGRQASSAISYAPTNQSSRGVSQPASSRGPSTQAGYAAAPASPKDEDEGDWFL